MRQSWANQWRHRLGAPFSHFSVRMLANLEKQTKNKQTNLYAMNGGTGEK